MNEREVERLRAGLTAIADGCIGDPSEHNGAYRMLVATAKLTLKDADTIRTTETRESGA